MHVAASDFVTHIVLMVGMKVHQKVMRLKNQVEKDKVSDEVVKTTSLTPARN